MHPTNTTKNVPHARPPLTVADHLLLQRERYWAAQEMQAQARTSALHAAVHFLKNRFFRV